MNILIATPAPPGSETGNRITAERYQHILKRLGHEVQVVPSNECTRFDPSSPYDLLIALHALKSAEAVKAFSHLAKKRRSIVVVLTGTDLHRDTPDHPVVCQTLDRADRIVLLEPEGMGLLEERHVQKGTVILQSALPVLHPPPPRDDCFEIALVGHLRPVKAPFLVIEALDRLPSDSNIGVTHVGAPLSESMKTRALAETQRNPRYEWIGKRSHAETEAIIARSRLLLLTSKMEGAPSVLSEAIVNGVPVLATRITASIGLLGADYGGLFEVGDAAGLSRLMAQAETDPKFYASLKAACLAKQPQFAPEREHEAWHRLLRELENRSG